MGKLSVFCKYIIRKVLSKYRGQLKSVMVQGASPEISTVCDLDAVLVDLYLDEDAINNAVTELEHLTTVYRRLEGEPLYHQRELGLIEGKVLWILGLKFLAEVA
ncbi:hypothetical protein GlitD10_0476 [Gloeomargarita lithophora Alchichica-D10]|uniref:Uncharacterized protein n=1 Tax=Gloeomargarita lithophora Alchichica-D10 TaxID=1188229 RepID=A0A1J0AA17_9CYAN|nr:hypothetical protein [Gloeomargarita lithophora]APB32788.1 hypothetical protein GlitD10_0476 [Gloeomargarita lithophora Alchichica-D10]